jgi:SAM-dependent methyltransferase
VPLDLYKDKLQDYFDEVRLDLVELIPGRSLRILDIGCGTGATGAYLLKQGIATWVAGVELMPEQGARAALVLDQVVVGDIGEVDLPWPARMFDCVLAGDVLEHLPAPAQVLIRFKDLMKSDGVLVASLPNVRQWPVIRDLVLKGEWEYRSSGVLDATHLRFFTKRSIKRMLEECGYAIETMRPYLWGPKTVFFNRATFGLYEEFLAQRWLIRARVIAVD